MIGKYGTKTSDLEAKLRVGAAAVTATMLPVQGQRICYTNPGCC